MNPIPVNYPLLNLFASVGPVKPICHHSTDPISYLNLSLTSKIFHDRLLNEPYFSFFLKIHGIKTEGDLKKGFLSIIDKERQVQKEFKAQTYLNWYQANTGLFVGFPPADELPGEQPSERLEYLLGLLAGDPAPKTITDKIKSVFQKKKNDGVINLLYPHRAYDIACSIIPFPIWRLENLSTLDLSNQNIGSLPSYTFQKLKNLQILLLNNLPLDGQLPRLESLESLRVLEINNVGLKEIPKSVSALKQLTHLEAKNNKCDSLTLNFFVSIKLELLDLSHNQIQTVTWGSKVSRSNAVFIKQLILRDNPILDFSESILFFNPKKIDLRGHHLKTIPANISTLSKKCEVLTQTKHSIDCETSNLSLSKVENRKFQTSLHKKSETSFI